MAQALRPVDDWQPKLDKKWVGDTLVEYQIDNDGALYAVCGQNVICGLRCFENLNLPPQILQNLRELHVGAPTTIQKHGMAQIHAFRDVLCCSRTASGSGKTATFMLPFLSYYYRNLYERQNLLRMPGRSNPAMLILVPTRELAQQIEFDAIALAKGMNPPLQCLALYGSDNLNREDWVLRRGDMHFIVATPERLLHILNFSDMIELDRVKFLVLDGADEMFKKGGFPQVSQIIERHMSGHRWAANRITVMSSATFPKELQFYARKYLRWNYTTLIVGLIRGANPAITQEFVPTDEMEKQIMLQNHLNAEKDNKVLVFCNSIQKVDHIVCSFGVQFKCAALHGQRNQYERDRTMYDFNEGRVKVMIATSVVAHELNINDAHIVINYDMPDNINTYIQCIETTTRGSRKTTTNTARAVSFFNKQTDHSILNDLILVLLDAKQKVPEFMRRLSDHKKGAEEQQSQEAEPSPTAFRGLKAPHQHPAAEMNERWG